MGNGSVVAEHQDVTTTLHTMHVARIDRDYAEDRWREAIKVLRRCDERVAVAEAAYARACRG